jgi:hypothetical protein
VSLETRLAEIVTALEGAGVSCLVLGGHAVRYYGLDRTTNDYDLHLAPDAWADLASRLGRTALLAGQPATEGPSWRPGDFRRFLLGRFPDGREEWLEFWRHNHLLAPFAELYSRREEGEYGGRRLPFLSLPDLIRSKETQRLHPAQSADAGPINCIRWFGKNDLRCPFFPLHALWLMDQGSASAFSNKVSTSSQKSSHFVRSPAGKLLKAGERTEARSLCCKSRRRLIWQELRWAFRFFSKVCC